MKRLRASDFQHGLGDIDAQNRALWTDQEAQFPAHAATAAAQIKHMFARLDLGEFECGLSKGATELVDLVAVSCPTHAAAPVPFGNLVGIRDRGVIHRSRSVYITRIPLTLDLVLTFEQMKRVENVEGKAKFGCLLFPILLVLGVAIWWSRLRWIPAGYVGVIYDAKGGLETKFYRPQRVFIGPFQQLYTYPTKLQAAIYTQDGLWGESRAADGIQITTSDNTTTIFDVAVYYRVKEENVFTAFRAFGPIPIEDIQVQHIRSAVREVANAVGTQYDVFSLIGNKREEASSRLTEGLRGVLARKGLTVERAMLLTAEPRQDITTKITARVNSYTQLTISKLQAQIAEISRQTAVTRAEAESKARTLTASSTQGKSLELMQLELQEAAVDAWNGKLPSIQPKDNQTIIVGADAVSSATARQGGKR